MSPDESDSSLRKTLSKLRGMGSTNFLSGSMGVMASGITPVSPTPGS